MLTANKNHWTINKLILKYKVLIKNKLQRRLNTTALTNFLEKTYKNFKMLQLYKQREASSTMSNSTN